MQTIWLNKVLAFVASQLKAFQGSNLRSQSAQKLRLQPIFRLKTLGLIAALASLMLAGGLMACSAIADAGPSASTAAVSFEAGLADHLTQTGAKMYGAYWCPHCEDQKTMFGAAVSRIPYVECDPKGEKAQPQLCQAKQIQGYPTWEIQGQLYPGMRSLIELSVLSNYSTAATSTETP